MRDPSALRSYKYSSTQSRNLNDRAFCNGTHVTLCRKRQSWDTCYIKDNGHCNQSMWVPTTFFSFKIWWLHGNEGRGDHQGIETIMNFQGLQHHASSLCRGSERHFTVSGIPLITRSELSENWMIIPNLKNTLKVLLLIYYQKCVWTKWCHIMWYYIIGLEVWKCEK